MRNQRLITLARNHCTRMEFVQNSGQGMAGGGDGPSDQPPRGPLSHRPQSHDRVKSRNDRASVLRENCVGCGEQRPTGLLPTLAGYIAAVDEYAAAEREREVERKAALHEEWEARAQRRRGLMAQCNDMMATALADVGRLDIDPADDRQQDDGAALAG